jgi:hypothetical protein
VHQRREQQEERIDECERRKSAENCVCNPDKGGLRVVKVNERGNYEDKGEGKTEDDMKFGRDDPYAIAE